MAKNPAKNAAKEAQAVDVKKAEKALAAKGITRPKHKPAATDPGEGLGAEAASKARAEEGVDSPPSGAVQSGFSVFNPQPPKEIMDKQDTPKPGLTDAEKAAKAEAKAEAKAAKDAQKKANIAAAAEVREAREAEKAKAKAARDEKAKARAAEREQAAAEAKAKGLNYTGSMLALRDAKNSYVKGTNGRLRSTDELAEALDAVQPVGTIAIAKVLLNPESDPYGALNVGQQSMNWRNRLRGALRKKTITIEQVIAARDAGNYTADTLAARADAEKKRQEREAAKAAAEQRKAALAEAKKEPEPATA